ncbi:hypothetical protein D3C83_229860 [compost metagenome]
MANLAHGLVFEQGPEPIEHLQPIELRRRRRTRQEIVVRVRALVTDRNVPRFTIGY